MKSESLIIGIPRSGGLQTSDIRAMAELGLCVTTNNLVILSWPEELLVLFR